MAFPSTLSTFNNPSPTDRLNSPSHSALHNAVSSALGQVETVIGVEGANSVVGTLEYLIKSPASDGGGHVQVANKGGTGQTTFTKGDLLVAQSSSVISKLAVGLDTQVLTASSVTATGVSWTDANPKPKLQVLSSNFTCDPAAVASIIYYTVPGSVMGENNAIRATAYITRWDATGNTTVVANYGGGFVASILVAGTPNLTLGGNVEFVLMSNQSSIAQKGFLKAELQPRNQGVVGSVYGSSGFGPSSINSSGDKSLTITVTGGSGNGVQIQGVIIERIS